MTAIIPKEILKLHKLFKNQGFELFLVGGSIRDFKKGETPKDYDLSTDALPDTIISILAKNGYEYNLQGRSFGVIVVYTQDGDFEIATFREDITQGRKPEVRVGATIEDDCFRRDFTVNSMFYDISKDKIIDITGQGINDLENNIISFVGNANERIKEDKLRILRAFRFCARYNGTCSVATKEALLKNNSLKGVSKERVFTDEILKAKKQCGENFYLYINMLSDYNMWKEIFSEFNTINIHIEKQKEYDIVLILANVLKNNDGVSNGKRIVKIEDLLTVKEKMPIEYTSKIGFLIRFIKDFKADDVFLWYKDFMRCGLSKKQLKQWLYNNTVSTYYTKFIYYEPVYTSIQIMDLLGIPHTDGKPDDPKLGKAIGDTMKEKEAERYAALIR